MNEILSNPTDFVREIQDHTTQIAQREKFGGARIVNNFYTFVLEVCVQQHIEKQNRGNKVIEIDKMVVLSALESALLPNEVDPRSAYKVSEKTILQTLNSRQFTRQDINSLFHILNSHSYQHQTQNV
jgi:hypothetical protein